MAAALEWSIEQVAQWARDTGYAEYAQLFTDQKVHGRLLSVLDDEALREDLGITNRMHRRGLLLRIQELFDVPVAASQATQSRKPFCITQLSAAPHQLCMLSVTIARLRAMMARTAGACIHTGNERRGWPTLRCCSILQHGGAAGSGGWRSTRPCPMDARRSSLLPILVTRLL